MILDKFNALTPLHQTTLVWQHGIPVAELYDRLYAYALYQLFDFYVEVKFCRHNFVLCELCGFSSHSQHLDLYIREIDISAIAC